MLAFTVARRILTELWHTRRSLVGWAVFPALMLLLFGLIYADGVGGTPDSFNLMAPSILIGAALFFSCLGGPIAALVAERERNTLKRLLLSPLGGTEYFIGVTLAHLVIAAGQVVIVYGIAFAFGGRFLGSLPLGVLIVALSVTSYVGVGFFFGSRFAKRTEDVNGPVAAIGVPLLVLGGTFFPPSMLPPYLLSLAHLNPIFHMNEALDPVSADGLGWAAVQDHMIFLFLFAFLSIVLGARSYRRMLAKERLL
ncbi:MAG: ABC transporter permease [Gemmatimonadetes bacterium]|nr:ABC transporter permease [Gemmatimonadota bacterium]NNM04603.1 ABC transporter permease [Gemmatimonadota bacterium]